jgi:hypothetical protein
MAKSYTIRQKDMNKMCWADVRATSDYDAAKDDMYSESFPAINVPRSDTLEHCTKYIHRYLPQIRHGDIVYIGETGNNENLAFWSSTEGVILPDVESGSVPSHFRVGNGTNEFSPTHWTDMDDFDYYDSLIWLSDELISNVNTMIIKNMEGSYSCDIMIRGKTVHLESAIPDPTKFEVMTDTYIASYE